MMRADREGLGEFRCQYCDRVIREGQHYVRAAFALDTAGLEHIMREPSLIAGAEFDTLHCARFGMQQWVDQCIADGRVQDTFDPRHG